MPIPDYGQMFRQMGEDVSGAILAPVQARLEMAKMKHGLAKEKADADTKSNAADIIGKTYGEDAAALYRAGEPLTGIAALRKSAQENGKRRRSGDSESPGRYGGDFNIGEKMTPVIQAQLDGALEAVHAAYESGDEDKIAEAQQTYNDMYEAYGEKIRDKVANMDKDLKKTRAALISERVEDQLAAMHPDKISAMSQVVAGGLDSYSKASREIMTDLEDANNEYGAGIDLSGIPSAADVKKYVWAATSKGDLDPQAANVILNAKSPKELEQLSNDKDRPMAERKLAGALIKQYAAYDGLDSTIREKFSAMDDNQLAEAAFGKDVSTPVKSRIAGAAESTLEDRGKFKDRSAFTFESTRSKRRREGYKAGSEGAKRIQESTKNITKPSKTNKKKSRGR